jgi:hypothetical protein
MSHNKKVGPCGREMQIKLGMHPARLNYCSATGDLFSNSDEAPKVGMGYQDI